MPRYASIAPMLVSASLLAACAGSSSTSTDSAANAKAASGIAFANCMRAHGVPNFPDPGSNGNGGLQIRASARHGSGPSLSINGVAVNGPAFQSAMRTCQHYLPNGGHPSTAQIAAMRTAALAMARCMRTHGVPDFPDPTIGTGPAGGVSVRIGGAGADPSSPAFQAAQKVCQPLFGKSISGGGSTAQAP